MGYGVDSPIVMYSRGETKEKTLLVDSLVPLFDTGDGF